MRALAGLLPRRAWAASGLVAAARAGLVVGQAELLARAVAERAVPLLAGVAAVAAARAAVAWVAGVSADRTAARVTSDLRRALLRLPAGAGATGAGATLLTSGLDALAGALSGYLPQLALAAVVPPVVLVALGTADLLSALVVLAMLPLIPVFGALVGRRTRDLTGRQWAHLEHLGGHVRDVLAGLSTLRAFDRTGHQAGVLRRLADGHRVATVRALRVAFLSGLVLELAGALTVALVAVPVGLRLLDGRLGLTTALVVLLLVPEAVGPLRTLGTRFHTAGEGMAVAAQVRAELGPSAASEPEAGWRVTGGGPVAGSGEGWRVAGGGPVVASGSGACGRVAGGGRAAGRPAAPGEIRLEDVVVRFPGRAGRALDEVSLTVRRGERLAVVGPSGAGKSTLVRVLLGLVEPESGRVLVDGADLRALDLDAWRERLAWVPQHPHLFAVSVADNVRLGAPGATPAAVRAAAGAALVDDVVAALPAGYDTVLGERGAGLSAGQRQRLALARAWLRDAPVVLLDEPTARLDLRSEAAVVASATRLLAGRTALVVAHRAAVLAACDRVVRLEAGRVVADERLPTRESGSGPGRVAVAARESGSGPARVAVEGGAASGGGGARVVGAVVGGAWHA